MPQEIRTSLYHSNFYIMLYRINLDERWRRLIGIPEPDIHMKDVEILLRGFAMLINGRDYRPSMTRFLNKFSNDAKSFSEDQVKYFEGLFNSFLQSCEGLSERAFKGKTNRINISMYESIFTAVCRKAYVNNSLDIAPINEDRINELKDDEDFINVTQSEIASKPNVETRLRRAQEILSN